MRRPSIGSAARRSAKVEALLDLARRSPEKKIVFTRFRATLDELDAALTAAGHRVSVFHGGLSSVDKQRAIDAFEDDAEILLSTEVGGEGRNLQFCRTVINYDLPWNPATIEQRVGRVHRIGQTRDVYIFNLCLAGSVEERILSILHDKINMFELVAGEVEMILGHLGDDQDFASLVMDAWSSSRSGEDAARDFRAAVGAIARRKVGLSDARRISIGRSSARTMRSSTLIGRLTADLLTRAGAIVDSGPGQALDVMAEPALRGALGLGEFERLSFEPGVAGSTFIDYDAPLVDRLAADRQWARPRRASTGHQRSRERRSTPPLSIDRGMTIHNGVHRYHSHAAVDADVRRCDVRVHRAGRRADGRRGHHLGQPSDAIHGEFRIADRSDVTPRRSGRGQSIGPDRWIDRRMAARRRIRSRAHLRPGSPTFSSGSAGGASATCDGCASITRRSISRSDASSRALGWTTICAGASAIVSTPRIARFTRAVRRWPIAIASVSVSRRLACGCVVCPRITST